MGLVCIAPDVIAGEADVLPAERCDVTEQVLVDGPALPPKLAIGGLQISPIPEDDGRDQQIEPGRAEELVLVGTVTHLAETTEVDGAGQRVARLPFVEAEMGPPPQIGGS